MHEMERTIFLIIHFRFCAVSLDESGMFRVNGMPKGFENVFCADIFNTDGIYGEN